MKKYKILVSVIICFIIFALSVGVTAEPLYTASLSLDSNAKTTKPIYVNVNETVSVSLKLKTSKGYYAGPFSTPVFYTDSVLSAESPTLNTSGRMYNCCKSYTSVLPASKLNESAKTSLYPSKWDSSKIMQNNLLYTVMIPNAADCKNTPDSLDETIWTVNFKIKNAVGSQGSVFIPTESVRTKGNISG